MICWRLESYRVRKQNKSETENSCDSFPSNNCIDVFKTRPTKHAHIHIMKVSKLASTSKQYCYYFFTPQ